MPEALAPTIAIFISLKEYNKTRGRVGFFRYEKEGAVRPPRISLRVIALPEEALDRLDGLVVQGVFDFAAIGFGDFPLDSEFQEEAFQQAMPGKGLLRHPFAFRGQMHLAVIDAGD